MNEQSVWAFAIDAFGLSAQAACFVERLLSDHGVELRPISPNFAWFLEEGRLVRPMGRAHGIDMR